MRALDLISHTKVITAKELIEIENLVQGEINLSTNAKKHITL